MEFILGCVYFVVTGAVIVSMTALFLQGEKNLSNKMYLGCHAMVTIWCSSQLLLFVSNSMKSLIFTYMYGNIGICFAGAFWLCFSLSYYEENKKKIYYILPFIPSAAHYLLILTNSWHNMYYSEFSVGQVERGMFFFTNVLETYLFILVGSIIIFSKMSKAKSDGKQKHHYRKNGVILIVLAVAIPLCFSVISLSGLLHFNYDITALGFACSVILVRIATIRYQFFDMKRELDITSEKLILEKERNRIAQQVHDTAGHTLTMLQSYMKLTEVAVKDDDKETAIGYIDEARSLTGKGIRELRESINNLRAGEQFELVTQGIMQLASQVKEIECEVTVRGEDSEKYSHLSKIIYDTTRESITNTMKYAGAGKIDILVRFQEDSVELMIADDGHGCDDIKDNNGLRGIRQRVKDSGGTVRFVSSAEGGFMTRVKIPV